MISLFLYRFPFTLLFLFRCCFRFRFRFLFPFPFLFRIPVSGFSRRPWILPFFKGNLQQHHFIFIVYYRGRKISSSFLWLTSFFPQSGRFTSNIFDEDTTPTVHAAGTADEGQNEGVTCPYCTLPPVSSVLLFSYITHVEYWSATRKRISCDFFVPDWWQDRIVIKLQLTGKSRLILCLFSNFCVFSFNIR